MNGRRRRAKMEISWEEERAAVAARSIHSLLLKLTLLVLILVGLLLASLPSLPSFVLLRELMPPVAFYGVRMRRRVRGRGREVVAVMVRGVTVPRGEGGGAEGRHRRTGGGRAGRGGGEDRRGFVEGAGSDQGRINLEREGDWSGEEGRGGESGSERASGSDAFSCLLPSLVSPPSCSPSRAEIHTVSRLCRRYGGSRSRRDGQWPCRGACAGSQWAKK